MSSSTAIREYQVVVCERGSIEVSDATIEFVIAVGSGTETSRLFQVPVFNGQTVYPLQGRSDMRPFVVEGVDVDGTLTTAFAIASRWAALGRLVGLRYRNVDEDLSPDGAWVYYGTGSISQFDALDGEGKYRASISDQTWKGRVGTIFEHANTTQLWPAGHTHDWRGFKAAIKADANLDFILVPAGAGRVFRVTLLAVGFDGFEGSTHNTGARVTDKLVSWIRDDLLPEEEWTKTDAAAFTDGNFRHLRLHYDEFDFEILTFSPTGDGPILQSIEDPEFVDGGSGSWAIRIECLCFRPDGIAIGDIPENAQAYLYAPTATPSKDLPLHGGIADPTHEFGTTFGFIHIADFVDRFVDHLGIVKDTANLTAHMADKSLPAIAPRIDESPADPIKWLQDKILAFSGLATGRDGQGRFKLIDLRPKRTVEEGIPVLDATNSRNHRWKLGTELITSVNYKYLKIRLPPAGIARMLGTPIPALPGGYVENEDDLTLDNFFVEEDTTEPEDGTGTIEDTGRILHTYDARAAANIAPGIGPALGLALSGAGASFSTYRGFTTPATLTTYQDGLIRGFIEVEGTLAETMEEGDEFFIDYDSLKIPTPGRLGGGIPGSAGPVVPGGSAPTLDDPPTLGTPTLLSDLSIQVPVATIPAALTARVEYAANTSAVTPPTESSHEWLTAGTRTTAGDVFVPIQLRGTDAWIRVSGEDSDGVRQTTYSTPVVVAIPDQARFDSALLMPVGGGSFVVTWDPASLTLGVRVCYVVHLPTATPGAPTCVDVDASALGYTIPVTVPIRSALTVTLTAYPGFSAGAVTGSAGEVLPLFSIRRETFADTIPETLLNTLQIASGVYPARNNHFRTHQYVGAAPPPSDSIDGDFWVVPPTGP